MLSWSTPPGTRWCGAGTRAKTDSELGLFKGADMCCRDHDKCTDFIMAGQSSHGLNNSRPFTLCVLVYSVVTELLLCMEIALIKYETIIMTIFD